MRKHVRGGVVTWFGGKGITRHRIAHSIPYTDTYVEPYGGSGAIMMSRHRSPHEVYNDLCIQLVDIMRALSDPVLFQQFTRRLKHTLYSRAEYDLASQIFQRRIKPRDVVDSAWATFVGMRQGFGGRPPTCVGSWGRAFISSHGMAMTVGRWWSAVESLDWFHERMSGVKVLNRNALDVIREYDSNETTFYIDPPYITETRKQSSQSVYLHEANQRHYQKLIRSLLEVCGAVVLSGYDAANAIYKPLFDAGWLSRSFKTFCMAEGRVRGSKVRHGKANERTEVVFINPTAMRLIGRLK